MGDHDDQAVVGDFGEQVHDLDARFRVECACRLVGKKDLGVVDESACDGDALHLASRHLRGLLVDMLGKPHALKRLNRALVTLFARHARQRQCKLDVCEHRLVGDKVVALEHEANAVVAIGIPVAVLVLLG